MCLGIPQEWREQDSELVEMANYSQIQCLLSGKTVPVCKRWVKLRQGQNYAFEDFVVVSAVYPSEQDS